MTSQVSLITPHVKPTQFLKGNLQGSDTRTLKINLLTYRAENIWNNLSTDVRGKGSFKDFKDSIYKNKINKITFGSLATGRSQFNRFYLLFGFNYPKNITY